MDSSLQMQVFTTRKSSLIDVPTSSNASSDSYFDQALAVSKGQIFLFDIVMLML